MSEMKPTFKRKDDFLSRFYSEEKNGADLVEVTKEAKPVSKIDLKNLINEYGMFIQDSDNFYTFAKLAASLRNKDDVTVFYFSLFSSFLVETLSKMYPEKNVSEIDKKCKELKNLLAEFTKNDNMDTERRINEKFIHSLIGIMHGMI